ncbi:MAG TPA: ABC transporter ATP-binding protein, partial [Solirubrobacteraceae bacterium]
MRTAVDAREVSVKLGGTVAVDRASISIERGEWAALIGPNGAGKTSLLRALAGIVSATGTIRLQERDQPLTG